ncbi:MAG: START domain-containing protein [Syntrophaceae bacterium]
MRANTILSLLVLSVLIWTPDMALAQEWKVVSRSDGIVGYSRPSGSPLDEVRAVGVVAAPLPVLEAVLRDIPAEKRFGYRCAEAHRVDIPGVTTTPDAFPIYYRMQLPYPVQDRDTVWSVHFSHNPAKGILKAELQSLDTDYAKHTGVVRMRKGNAVFTLKALDAGRTEVDYTAQCDPSGNLPAFLVNMIIKDFAPTTIARMREVAKDPKYTAAGRVMTKTLME